VDLAAPTVTNPRAPGLSRAGQGITRQKYLWPLTFSQPRRQWDPIRSSAALPRQPAPPHDSWDIAEQNQTGCSLPGCQTAPCQAGAHLWEGSRPPRALTGLILQPTGALRNKRHFATNTSNLSFLYLYRAQEDWADKIPPSLSKMFSFPQGNLHFLLPPLPSMEVSKPELSRGQDPRSPSHPRLSGTQVCRRRTRLN